MSLKSLGRIAYVSPVQFRSNSAAPRRMLGVAQSLNAAGYEVLIGSGQMPDGKPPTDLGGITVHSLGERTAEHYPTLVKHLIYFFMGKKTRQWLERLNPRPKAVILYSGYAPFFMRLLPWCRQHGIPLIFDAVEWYDADNIPGGRFSPYRWNFELAMRYYCVRAGNIIAISKYLDGYYRQRHCQTVRVPPTLDTQAVEPNLNAAADSPITIGYAGSPTHKDLFDHFLEAMLRLDPDGRHLRLRVAGVTPQQSLRFPSLRRRGYTELPACVEALGMIPHAEAMAIIRNSDYTVLLRPPRREAQAGFPTKVVESLAVGTPVICNLTSDLGDYIRDGEEGVLCHDHQPASLVEALQRLCSFTPQQRQKMRLAARRQAEKAFDYRNYITPLADFMAKIGAA